MLNPGLPEPLWSLLDGRLWHATSPDSLVGILKDSEIRPSDGKKNQHSFCRTLGSISLFDFGRTARDEWNQFNNWGGWFGGQQCSRTAIWLGINRDTVSDNLLDAGATHIRWLDERHKQIIPGVEACHKGPIPLTSIVSTLLISRYDKELFQQFDELDAGVFRQIENFEAKLLPPTHDSIYKKFEARRKLMNRGSDGI